MVALAARFAEDYLPPEFRDLPVSPPKQGDILTKLRWVQVSPEDAPGVIAQEMMDLAPSADPEQLAMADITLLAADQDTGIAVAEELEALSVRLEHTFAAAGGERLVREEGIFSKGTSTAQLNCRVEDLSADQRELLAQMLQVERTTAVFDTLRHAHETPLGFDVPSHYVGTRFPATRGQQRDHDPHGPAAAEPLPEMMHSRLDVAFVDGCNAVHFGLRQCTQGGSCEIRFELLDPRCTGYDGGDFREHQYPAQRPRGKTRLIREDCLDGFDSSKPLFVVHARKRFALVKGGAIAIEGAMISCAELRFAIEAP